MEKMSTKLVAEGINCMLREESGNKMLVNPYRYKEVQTYLNQELEKVGKLELEIRTIKENLRSVQNAYMQVL